MFRSIADIFLVIWKRSKFWLHDLYALPQLTQSHMKQTGLT